MVAPAYAKKRQEFAKKIGLLPSPRGQWIEALNGWVVHACAGAALRQA
jgi:hypothetical protein